MVKLNDSFSGEGNAIFRYPEDPSESAVEDELRHLEFAVPTETPVLYFEKLGRMGGIVEEFIEAPDKSSPSAQLRISPAGEVLPISTHDQILGGAQRAGLPRLHLPRRRGLPHAHPGRRRSRSGACWPATAW